MSALECQLCGRVTKRGTTEHHLIPRTCHSNKWFKKRFTKTEMKSRGVDLCADCHSHIHALFTEKELGRNFNTLAALSSNGEVAKFVAWVKKQQ